MPSICSTILVYLARLIESAAPYSRVTDWLLAGTTEQNGALTFRFFFGTLPFGNVCIDIVSYIAR